MKNKTETGSESAAPVSSEDSQVSGAGEDLAASLLLLAAATFFGPLALVLFKKRKSAADM